MHSDAEVIIMVDCCRAALSKGYVVLLFYLTGVLETGIRICYDDGKGNGRILHGIERIGDMGEKRKLPIGNDDFRKLRKSNAYYVDKTIMIHDFIEMQDEVALIARPRRFGKTLNMTMLREFFDISVDSRDIFEGLSIMDTEYAGQINSRPVVYLTLKDCKGINAKQMFISLKTELYREYLRQEGNIRGMLSESYETEDFYSMIEVLRNVESSSFQFGTALLMLTRIVKTAYKIPPVLLIDEYDQPIMSSYEYGYHDEVGVFFSNFYGSAMKGNPNLGQALMTGVQRVAKESIFSQFNNPKVYTVLHNQYDSYFGLTAEETKTLLHEYDLELNEEVRKKYDGYRIGKKEMYNPWSILNYADNGFLDNYWVNTSANFLVRQALKQADGRFWKSFEVLASGEETTVWLTLETSYAERDSNYTLWGLLVNAGYLTVARRIDSKAAVVRIPNDEVMTEFQILVSEIAGIEGMDLQQMFDALMKKDLQRFFSLYQDIVISCTSYMDAKANAYHMLFLGMCITLRGVYKVTSNLETGYGRSDISLQSMSPDYISVIVEFKQGEDIDRLKEEALQQILDNRYYTGMTGEVLCVGLAHDKKRCSMAYKILDISK